MMSEENGIGLAPDKHVELLGKLVANMQSLETLLRFSLLVAVTPKNTAPAYHQFLSGEMVDEDAFADYRTLGELIKAYNRSPQSAGLEVDDTLEDIRDAIAHGRTFSTAPSGSMLLLKFDRPKHGKVKVVFSALMTYEWFDQQITRFLDAWARVDQAIKRQQTSRT